MQIPFQGPCATAATIGFQPAVNRRSVSSTSLFRGAIAVALVASTAALPWVTTAAHTPAAGRSFRTAPAVTQVRSLGMRSSPKLGNEPLAFVVHPTHPPVSLDWPTALRLAGGRLADWREIDGGGRPLHLVLGPAAASRLFGVWLLLGTVPAGVRLGATEQAAAQIVAGDPDAAGLVAGEGLSPAVRAATLDGVDPVRDPAHYRLLVPGAAPETVTTAIAFGDIMTSRTVDKKMVALNDFLSPFRSVGPALAAADLAFGNFEGTISHDARPQPGGTRFVSRIKAIDGFRFAGLDFLSLANNHIGDYGAGTLRETVALLRGAGIAVAGAGADLAGAREPAVVVRNGVRFGFVSFNAIIGTPEATPNSAGAERIEMAPWFPFSAQDLARVVEDVRTARKKADVVIVFPHWGQEYTARPNADQVRVAHALIDAGADMLIATHPHWVQGAEIYKGHLIAYSLGNFVFDQTWSVETQQGAALQLVWWGHRLVSASFVPVQIEDAHRPRFVSDQAGAAILARIWGASGEPYVRAS